MQPEFLTSKKLENYRTIQRSGSIIYSDISGTRIMEFLTSSINCHHNWLYMHEAWNEYAIVIWYEFQSAIQPLLFTNIDLRLFHVVTTICSWKFHYPTCTVTDLFLLYFRKYDAKFYLSSYRFLTTYVSVNVKWNWVTNICNIF